MWSWNSATVIVVLACACTPVNSPDPEISFVEALSLEKVAQRSAWPAYNQCKKAPHPAGCDAFLDLLLDTLFRARIALEHWGEPGLPRFYACLMTEAQTYLAQMDQKSLGVEKLDAKGRFCPR